MARTGTYMLLAYKITNPHNPRNYPLSRQFYKSSVHWEPRCYVIMNDNIEIQRNAESVIYKGDGWEFYYDHSIHQLSEQMLYRTLYRSFIYNARNLLSEFKIPANKLADIKDRYNTLRLLPLTEAAPCAYNLMCELVMNYAT